MPDGNLPVKKINWLLVTLLLFGVLNTTGFITVYRRIGALDKSNQKTPPPTSVTSDTSVPAPDSTLSSSDISAIKDELVQIRAEQHRLQQVLGTSDPDSLSDVLPDVQTVPSVTIADSKFQSVEVYQLPLASSKIVGNLSWGVNYPFTSQQGSWYQITLPDGTYGWVNAQLVKQI